MDFLLGSATDPTLISYEKLKWRMYFTKANNLHMSKLTIWCSCMRLTFPLILNSEPSGTILGCLNVMLAKCKFA